MTRSPSFSARSRELRSGVDPHVSLHHDIRTITGEQIVLFSLAAAADFRKTKKK